MTYAYRGVRYDVDKSLKIGSGASAEADKGSPEWWRATLYITPTGRYFLAGEGNSMTPFANRAIVPLTDKKQARIWASWFISEPQFSIHFGGKR